YVALPLGKVRRVRHSGHGDWAAGPRIQERKGRSAKRKSLLRLNGAYKGLDGMADRREMTSVDDGSAPEDAAEMTEHQGESRRVDAPGKGKAGAAIDRDAKPPHTAPAAKPATPGAPRPARRRLLLGVLGVLVLAAALWFGIPWIRLTLTTVSTDD